MSEWVEMPLGQLAKFQKGRKVATSDYQQAEYDVYLGASSLGGAIEGYASTKFAVLAEPNDVLMLWDGERSGLVGHGLRGVVSSTVQRLMPGKEVTGTYLYYHLLSRFDWIQGRRTGTGVPHVPKDLARILTVNYPVNHVEQERITDVLASLDKTIEKTEALIAKYQHIKAGLMHDLFTRGVTADGKLRPSREQAPGLYQETLIGLIPKEWSVVGLDQACQHVIDCPHSTPNFVSGGVLVARTMHIKDSVFLEGIASRVSETEYRERIARLTPTTGDVVFTREAPVGEAFVIPHGMRICLGQRVMLIRPKASVLDSDYLVAQIYSGSLSLRIAELTAGTTNPHLNVADVRNLAIAVPSFFEQTLMTKRIKAINAHVHQQRASLEKLKLQKLGLMSDLLTGKVRVQYDSKTVEMAGA